MNNPREIQHIPKDYREGPVVGSYEALPLDQIKFTEDEKDCLCFYRIFAAYTLSIQHASSLAC